MIKVQRLRGFQIYCSIDLLLNDKLVIGDVDSLAASGFVKRQPIKLLIHGYRDSGETQWILNIRDALLNDGQ